MVSHVLLILLVLGVCGVMLGSGQGDVALSVLVLLVAVFCWPGGQSEAQ